MPIINNFKETETFIASKLIEAQLDKFCVYSLDLQLNFLGGLDGNLQNYWLCMAGKVRFFDGKEMYYERSKVIANLYPLIGQRVSAAKIENRGLLSLHFADEVITVEMDDDNLEIVWSLTPDSPGIYQKNSWSVVLTDDSDLVMSVAS